MKQYYDTTLDMSSLLSTISNCIGCHNFMVHQGKLLLSVSSMIIALLFATIFQENHEQDDAALTVEAVVEQVESPKRIEKPRTSPADLVTTIRARPLFEPDRRPTAPSQVQEPALVMPRLAGIVTAPGYSVALFQQGSSPRPIALKAGEVLEKLWTVAAITAGQVTLARDDKMLVLTPHSAANRDPPHPEPPKFWKVGLRRSEPLPSYLQRRK